MPPVNEGRALVIDDGDLMTGRILERVLGRAGWETELVAGSRGFDALRERPPALVVVRQRTVYRTMDARPFIAAGHAAADHAGGRRPLVVVFANFGGSAMQPADFDDVADLVIDVPSDLPTLERRFRALRRQTTTRG
jgi:hypothetical protein